MAFYLINISLASSEDWKESLRERNVSLAQLKFAEWMSALKDISFFIKK